MSAGASLALFACWFGGALAARAALAFAPGTLAADLAQPVPVVFGFRWLGLAFVGILIATSAIGAAVAARCARTSSGTRPAVALLCGAALAGACAWPAIISSDVYAYAGFGQRAAGGAGGAIARAAAWQWGRSLPPDNYGPLFDLFAGGITAIAGDRPGAAIAAFRAAACLSLVAGALALRVVAGGTPAERSRAALAFALNPIAIWSAGEGHNDLTMIAIVLGGLALARRFPIAGGFIAAAAGLFKLPAIVAALILAAIRRRARRAFAAGVCAGTLLAIAGSVPLAAAALTRAGASGHTFPMLYPWYLTWALPLLALSPQTRTWSLGLAPLAFAAYAPDAFGTPSIALRAALSLTVAAVFVPLTFVAWLSMRRQTRGASVSGSPSGKRSANPG